MSKYVKGERITTIDELMEQDFVIFNNGTGSQDKCYNKGWYQCWQLRMASLYVNTGRIYKAIIREDIAND